METNAGLTLKENSTPAPQMPPDTGNSWETNNSIKFPACSGAVSMEHLPAAPLCLHCQNQRHRFFLWDAQLLSTVLPKPLGRQLGSFSQNKLQGSRDRDEAYSGKQLVAEGVGDWVFFQTPGK